MFYSRCNCPLTYSVIVVIWLVECLLSLLFPLLLLLLLIAVLLIVASSPPLGGRFLRQLGIAVDETFWQLPLHSTMVGLIITQGKHYLLTHYTILLVILVVKMVCVKMSAFIRLESDEATVRVSSKWKIYRYDYCKIFHQYQFFPILFFNWIFIKKIYFHFFFLFWGENVTLLRAYFHFRPRLLCLPTKYFISHGR